jgi:hypothetical protein
MRKWGLLLWHDEREGRDDALIVPVYFLIDNASSIIEATGPGTMGR